jgi:hypothetical protein
MAHFCENCGRDFTNVTCPRCGGPPAPRVHEPVSVADDSLDTMIEQASRPTLATLLKRGIDSGAIKPSHEYAAGSTPN